VTSFYPFTGSLGRLVGLIVPLTSLSHDYLVRNFIRLARNDGCDDDVPHPGCSSPLQPYHLVPMALACS